MAVRDRSLLVWRHHCRHCGGVYCGECANNEHPLLPPRDPALPPSAQAQLTPTMQRVCTSCFKALAAGGPVSRLPPAPRAVTSRSDGDGGVAVFRSAREAASPTPGLLALGPGQAAADADDVYAEEVRNPRSRTELPKTDFDW